jgi:hypothetical protein
MLDRLVYTHPQPNIHGGFTYKKYMLEKGAMLRSFFQQFPHPGVLIKDPIA